VSNFAPLDLVAGEPPVTLYVTIAPADLDPAAHHTVGGAAGVAKIMRILRTEQLAAMALCGCPTLAAIHRAVLSQHE
jgi:isopentenyl diphosphate isomerase/L-lactate dehydrogenase-like FMN-dependent dehydrogenase